MTHHFYQPAQGHGLPHDPFNAIIAPRPIGWISSLSPTGVANLAPYSFFNGFNYTPPIIGFCSLMRKDSLVNVEASGEFVWNLVTEPLAQAMNLSCSALPPEHSEFDLAGLTQAPSQVVKAPRVAESPVSMECRLTQIVQLKNAQGTELSAWLVLGEVVGVHIDHALLDNGIYQTARARPITRGGGPGDYFVVTPETQFQMPRPDNWNQLHRANKS
jgi:flavin reductase (DIM6/NTAB) family NADH-FMN oxidoreductase RutF